MRVGWHRGFDWISPHIYDLLLNNLNLWLLFCSTPIINVKSLPLPRLLFDNCQSSNLRLLHVCWTLDVLFKLRLLLPGLILLLQWRKERRLRKSDWILLRINLRHSSTWLLWRLDCSPRLQLLVQTHLLELLGIVRGWGRPFHIDLNYKTLFFIKTLMEYIVKAFRLLVRLFKPIIHNLLTIRPINRFFKIIKKTYNLEHFNKIAGAFIILIVMLMLKRFINGLSLRRH